MDNQNEQNQQGASQPLYHQTVVIVGKQKSVGVAFILAFFFGPLGLLYASVVGGIVMFFVGVLIAIVTLGIGLIFVWIGCIIWAVVAANNANNKILPQQPIGQLVSQPPLQQSIPAIKATPNFVDEPPQKPNPIEANKSLDAFGEWVIANKKGLMLSLGGIIITLVLILAVKYVVDLKFSHSTEYKKMIVSVDSSKRADSVKMMGDANTPTQFVPNSSGNNNDNTSTTYGTYPQSTTRLLTNNDLSILNKQDLKIMRNEIFARHGYIFKTAEMKNYFNQQNWYKPTYSDVTNQLSDIEKTNVELIKSYEK